LVNLKDDINYKIGVLKMMIEKFFKNLFGDHPQKPKDRTFKN